MSTARSERVGSGEFWQRAISPVSFHKGGAKGGAKEGGRGEDMPRSKKQIRRSFGKIRIRERDGRRECIEASFPIPDDLRFHDLRHTGLTLLAGQGATVRELMDEAGIPLQRWRCATSTRSAAGRGCSPSAWARASTPGRQ